MAQCFDAQKYIHPLDDPPQVLKMHDIVQWDTADNRYKTECENNYAI